MAVAAFPIAVSAGVIAAWERLENIGRIRPSAKSKIMPDLKTFLRGILLSFPCVVRFAIKLQTFNSTNHQGLPFFVADCEVGSELLRQESKQKLPEPMFPFRALKQVLFYNIQI